jgi:hypothetical protein
VARPKPWEVSDELRAVVESLLPPKQRRTRWPGRKRLDDHLALQGILFVLHTGIAWEHLPQELGYGSGMTCRRRLNEWERRGGLAAEVGVEDVEGLVAGVDAGQEEPAEALDDPDQMEGGAGARSSVVCFDRVPQKAIRTPS